MGKALDIVNERYGKLLVISKTTQRTSSGSIIWKCICDCGNFTFVCTNSVRSGNTKSCGCGVGEKASSFHSKHKLSRKSIWGVWQTMKQRCFNKKHPKYENYGARGITVCDRWLESFENFYKDVGEPPENSDWSLDRIDVNGNYCPENCWWANRSWQMFNQTRKKNNTSGKTGVSFNKQQNLWHAYINVDNKRINLGLYSLLESAIKIREKAELEYYGFIKE